MLRRAGISPLAVLAASLSLLAAGCTPGPTAQPLGNLPSNGEIVAASIGIAAVVILVPTIVLVEVHQHHTVKGCLITGPSGMQIQETQDAKTIYVLEGAPADLKVGDLVRLHGNRGPSVKKGDIRTFKVAEVKKNYGACPAAPPAPANSH
jgi:hypothetical protein